LGWKVLASSLVHALTPKFSNIAPLWYPRLSRWLIQTDTDLAMIGEAATFAETFELVDLLKPDTLLLDLHAG
jgi:hypothetical protein